MSIAPNSIAGPIMDRLENDRSSSAAFRVRAATILDAVARDGPEKDTTAELLALLRSRNYSVCDLDEDVRAAKRRAPLRQHHNLDDFLSLCLRATAAIHELAIETMMHGFCELDEFGRIVFANRALLDMIPDCEGQKLDWFLDTDGEWLCRQIMPGAPRAVHRLEMQTPRRCGPVLIEVGPLADNVRGGFALVTDLAPEEDEQRRIDDLAEFAILRCDGDSRITYANPAACALLHSSLDEVLGRVPADFIASAAERERVEEQTARRRSGISTEYEVEIHPRSAERPIHLRIRSMPEMDTDGALSGIFVTLVPIDDEIVAEKIHDEVAAAEDPDKLFGAVVGHLRQVVAFELASLAVYTHQGRFSRLVRSLPTLATNQRWVPLPASIMDMTAAPANFGADIGDFLADDPDRGELLKNLGVQELIKMGLRGWASISVQSCDCHAVFTIMSSEKDCYNEATVQQLASIAVDNAMHRILKLDAERESAFQSALIKKMAQVQSDRELADLVVSQLASFYNWQNVSIFKVNALQERFELLTQAAADRDGFELPSGYRQPISQGYLGKALREAAIQVVGDSHDPTSAGEFVRGSELTRSEMCVPIRVQEKVVWILNLEDQRPHAFKEPDREAVERLMRELEPSLERALSAALLEQVLEDAPDGVVITDFDSQILRCNRAAAVMLGAGVEGRNLVDFFEPNSRGADVARRARSERSIPVEAELTGLDGTRTTVLMRSRVPRDEYERRILVLQDSRKIDWQVETRRLSAITSEARVPLSLASTFVHHIRKVAAEASPTLAKLADHAIKQLGRVELTYDQLAERQGGGHRSKLAPSTVLNEVVEDLPPLQRDLVKIVRSSGRLPVVRCDHAQLRSALKSMLAYMLRVGGVGNPVEIRLRAVSGLVEFRLFKRRNSDPGLPDHDAESSTAIDEARARAALDEPRLISIAAGHGGRFSRRRGAHGETLRLSVAAKGPTHV